MFDLLARDDVRQIILTAHIVSASIGFGGAMITDLLFFRFLKDFLVSKKEEEVMQMLATIVLTAMLVIIASGFGLYLGDPLKYNENPRFWIKMTAVLVACVNGLAMHLFISPRLLELSFRLERDGMLEPDIVARTRRLSRAAFAMGAVSAVSWWTALLIAMLKPLIGLGFTPLFVIYVLVVFTGVVISQIIERQYVRKGQSVGRLSRKWTSTESESK